MPEATPTATETNLNVISHQGFRQHQSDTCTLFIPPVILHATKENNDKNKRYVVLNVAIVLSLVALRVILEQHHNGKGTII